MPDASREAKQVVAAGNAAWIGVTGLSAGIFIIWLIVGGYRWQGYPCFTWDTHLFWRVAFFLALLAAVIRFCLLLLRVAVRREPLTGVSIALALVSFTLIRIVLASALPLLNDEAYHWLWADKIDWCYYDHPGMIGWVTYPFRLISKSVVSARMGPIIIGTITVLLAWRFAYWLSRDKAVANTCLAGMMITPLGLVGTTIVFTDTPLAIFWLASIWVTLIAVRKQTTRWWILLGVLWGLSLNCKFFGGLLIAMLGLYLLIDPAGRRTLRTFGPYLAGGVSLIVFSPTIVWNAFNGWQTFYFHLVSREPFTGFYPTGMLNYLGRQMLIVGPVLLVWCILIPAVWGYNRYRRGNTGHLALVLTCYVPFLMYVTLRVFRPVESGGDNWTGSLTAGLIIMLAWSAADSIRARIWVKHSFRAAAITTWAMLVILIGQVFVGPGPIETASRTILSPKKTERVMRAYYAWYPVGRELDDLYERYRRDGQLFVMARTYMQASNLTQYSRKIPLVLSYGNDSIFGLCFNYWNAPDHRQGQNCLYVSDHHPSRYILRTLRESFRTVEEVNPAQRNYAHPLARKFRIFYCRDMKRFPQAKM